MFTKLRLERFKNFRSTELSLGPFTLLVGTNAAGKSNIGEALRFLHGLGQAAEIFGEVRGEGGELVWKGVRGGTRKVARNGATTFEIETEFDTATSPNKQFRVQIEVAPGKSQSPPQLERFSS